MALTMAFKPGETIYYPKITVKSDKPMTVKDRYIGSKNGNLFVQYCTDDLLDRLVEDMHEVIDNHYDNVVVITGRKNDIGEGVGKSNLAYWVAKKFDPNFNLQDGYIYDMLPFLKRLVKGELHGKVLMLDEATNLLSARNWMTETNKSVDQILEMFRSYEMTLIMCIPQLDRLDVYVRESRMRFLLIAADRYWENDTVSHRGYFELKRRPGFKTVCWGTFPEIPPEDKKIYEALKEGAQKSKAKEILEKFEEDENKPRIAKSAHYNRQLVWMLKKEGYSYSEISDETGIPEGTLKSWISEKKNNMVDEDDE